MAESPQATPTLDEFLATCREGLGYLSGFGFLEVSPPRTGIETHTKSGSWRTTGSSLSKERGGENPPRSPSNIPVDWSCQKYILSPMSAGRNPRETKRARIRSFNKCVTRQPGSERTARIFWKAISRGFLSMRDRFRHTNAQTLTANQRVNADSLQAGFAPLQRAGYARR